MDLPVRTRESVLFVTLDSCRYDTFASARAPNIKAVGTLYRAQAPSYYTFGSHSSMFAGFTPGLAEVARPIINPKMGKLFKLSGGGSVGHASPAYDLVGRNIIEGFKANKFLTVGTGAVGWFDPNVPTGRPLTESFDRFFYPGNTYSLRKQLAWVEQQFSTHDGDIFAFLNVGETHVPYYHEDARWDANDNPCVPFQQVDRSADCRYRQRRCCEFVDGELGPLLDAFANSTILVCGDHGDCWGEDGLWEHGISHPATLTVPLMARVRGNPVR